MAFGRRSRWMLALGAASVLGFGLWLVLGREPGATSGPIAGNRTLRPQQGAAYRPAAQGARIALVIGNGDYPEAPLRNPVNDARAIKEALEACTFDVTLKTNVTKREMEEAIQAFGDRIRGGAVGLFYYAGHGVAVKGVNYLIPVGARLSREDDVPYEGVDVGRVLDKMDTAGNQLNILILDACRNNPFARSWRSASRGLVQVSAPKGSLIAYATAPGSTAADGSGDHGLYTEALLDKLKVPGESLLDLFQDVRAQVEARSQGQQIPWESNSTVGRFYFRPPEAGRQEAAGNLGGQVSPAATPRPQPPPVAPYEPPVLNLAEPWKALKRDAFESEEAYAHRIAGLGYLRVGTVRVDKANYQADLKQFLLPVQPEAWAKPFVHQVRMVVPRSPEEAQALCAAGTSQPLLARFQMVGNSPAATDLKVSTALGSFTTASEPPPVPGASRNPFGLWEATLDIGLAHQTGAAAWFRRLVAGKAQMQVPLTLVQIPRGRFTMGSPPSEAERGPDEGPQHPVTITRNFWLGKFDVTQGQWEAVMGDNPSDFKNAGQDAPVENVRWEDCQRFIGKLNEMQHQWVFRLPTESEWEYACRAGTEGEWYGNPDASAWHADNSGGTTHPVGQKQPNAFGLYDMLGDVWQWCQDWYGQAYYSQSPASDPQGPVSGQFRVYRGGSWSFTAARVRSAGRNYSTPDLRSNFLGFRVLAVARTQ